MKARALKQGDTVGLVAPASPSDKDRIERAIKNIIQMGYKVKAGESLYCERGYLAGRDELRARDINEMFKDDEVKAIYCLRGGYGTIRILDMLDYHMIMENPKIIMGFSDITAILNAIYKRTGLITFHGPMGGDFAKGMDRETALSMKGALECSSGIGTIPGSATDDIRTIAAGKGAGRLVGGNLSLVVALMGTEYEIDTKDCILLLEDMGEEPYSIDRMLHQLKLSGKLEDASGIILGDWKDCCPRNPSRSLSLEEVFEDVFAGLDKPVLSGYKIGHCRTNYTVPIGAKVHIDSSSRIFSVLEAGVK